MESIGSSLWYSRFYNLHIYMAVTVCIVTSTYWVTCGYLHWYYYVKRKEKSKEWKCQNKFPKGKEVLDSVIRGTLCTVLAGVEGSIFICYTMNGGYTTAYFNVSDYGVAYLISSIPLLLLFNEMVLYYWHRILHLPLLYKHIHKLHHKYKQPTAFSTISMHPLELIVNELLTLVPLFAFPIHWVVYFGVNAYVFHHSLMEHSGIKLRPLLPLETSTIYHDKHHELFEVNYGHFLAVFDKLHGTHWEEKKGNKDST